MTWLIDEIIAFLTDLRSDPLISQVLALAGIPGIVAFFAGIPVWLTTRKVRASVVAHDALEARLKTAHREAAKLQAEVGRLEAETAGTFLAAHRRETRDGNDERVMALAETFVERQREALLLAFRTRTDEAVRQSVEDGAPAFETARRWALAALALEPGDRTLRMLADDAGEAAGIAEASGGRVKLKGEQDRAGRADRDARLPKDLGALAQALFKARDQGHYAVMLVLAGHGLMLTRRPPYGPGSRDDLVFRRHRAEALKFVGSSKDALDEARPLVAEFARLFGEKVPETLYTRYLVALCRVNTGDAATALIELEELLPLYTEAQGARHLNVLGVRSLLAQCRKNTGDAATALAELQDLLPLYTETQRAQHPHALWARSLLARCRKDTGDAATALIELEELLPLYTEILGARHPHVLTTRGFIAECRKDTGDAATALIEIKELLPLFMEAQGARHPDVLTTRGLIAECRKDTGDAATALIEIEELLPLYTEILGARHPSVLDMHTLRAACLLDENDQERAEAEIEGVRAGLSGAKLRPEHQYFRRLEDVEERLQSLALSKERQTDEA